MLPPPSLRKLSLAGTEIKRFLLLGEAIKSTIDSIVKDQQISPSRILDHGCRCGIILQHWTAPVHAVDTNEECVAWCQRAIPRHQTDKITARSHLSYEPFDLIYSSLFLNLNESDQKFWIAELERLLAPGGLLLIFLRTERESLGLLTEDERKRLEAGDLVVRNPRLSGEADCQAFHPKTYAERLFWSMPLLQMIPAQTLRIDAFTAMVPTIAVLRKMG